MKIKTEKHQFREGFIVTETYVTYDVWWKEVIELLVSIGCFALSAGVAYRLDHLFSIFWVSGYMFVAMIFPSTVHFKLFTRKQDWFFWQTENLNGVVLMYTDSWGVHWVHPELEAAKHSPVTVMNPTAKAGPSCAQSR